MSVWSGSSTMGQTMTIDPVAAIAATADLGAAAETAAEARSDARVVSKQ
ncbi:hypothetical protein [Streptomyces sp. KR80]